jgi:hypothetical protein
MSVHIRLFSAAMTPENVRNAVMKSRLLSAATRSYELPLLVNMFQNSVHDALRQYAIEYLNGSVANKFGSTSEAFVGAYKAVCKRWFQLFRDSQSNFKPYGLV